ncbi:uncharacterized protein C20orf194 homolog isoform X2 [Cyprinodon tularosa]|uniref:uncharacterized protein C20orf194 homolog isoform X2 n=1 Tax=Cyprinodon tularosa TaxID=77115 RepID=UPI0018E231F2|nr:uncharacterized protein C20orf194 homolog isoform X2 [Cyprinodon tularosa]
MAGIRRVNAKLSGVNPVISCSRLRQVQALLCEGGPVCPDGILCSLGLDSRFNLGCSELAKYLFFGLYEWNLPNLEHALDDLPEEMQDDVIILIKAESVHLYCNPLNYSYLLPYVSHWRNLHLYCMTEAEYEDEEAAEEFKISSFVTMVQDCQRIGVAYSCQGYIQKFDMFMVEKWPLIQSFALEGIGGGSFFTLKYEVVDMSEKLWQVYNKLDPVSLDNLLTEGLAGFEKQWSFFFSRIDLESHLSILDLSEAQAGQAFRLFYSHGLISNNISDKSKSRQPFVLFGKHSSSHDLESISFNFPSESHQVRNTGPQGSTAKHMILQCVDATGPLACSRTYFFGTTHTPYLGIQMTEQKKTEVLVTSQVYSAAVQGVLSGIKCYSRTSSYTKAKDVAVNTFLLSLDYMNLGHYRSPLGSRCEFSIQAVNNRGIIIPLTDEDSCHLVKTASLIVSDIPALEENRGDLGTVVYSESFLESSINIQQRDGTMSSDSCYTILTANVPRYACWLMEPDVRQSEQAVLSLSKKEGDCCLGGCLTVADAAYLFSSGHLCSPDEGKITFFSEGLLFIHSQFGSITLSKNHIRKLSFCAPGLSRVGSLFVEYEASLLPHLPFPLHSSDQCLVFALQCRSKSYKAFYAKVLPAWKNPETGLCVKHVDQEQLPMNQRKMHTRLQELHGSQEPPVAKRKDNLNTSHSKLPELEMFLQHFALSSISQEPILYDHLEALFPSAELRNQAYQRGDKVIINIITGLPGSHKSMLCKFLVDPNKKGGRWVVYEPDSFSASHLQQYLSSFLESHRKQGKTRLLLLTPGYTDVLDVILAVLFHPDPGVQGCFTIGAVTACVNPLASFMEHRFAFPKLLEQCSQGIVSTVVFTGLTAEKKHPLMQHVQQLVRSANPTAAFILAERGAVTRNEDVSLILSKSSFSEAQMLRARYVLYPGWCKGRFFSGSGSAIVTQQRIAFSRPLERPLFVTRCKAIKSSLKPSPFRGNVYNIWGKVRFSDSNRTMDVFYNTVSERLSLLPDESTACLPAAPPQTSTTCFLVFDGVDLSQEELKVWLRLCTKQQDKKAMKTRATLSEQEIKSIHTARHLDPLPPGYFYNGYLYQHIYGEKRSFHPNMEEFIKEYISEANKEIEQFNHQLELELQGQPDMFDL